MLKIFLALMICFASITYSQSLIYKTQGSVDNLVDETYTLLDVNLNGIYKDLTLGLNGSPNGFQFDSIIVRSYIGYDVNNEPVFSRVPVKIVSTDSVSMIITPSMLSDSPDMTYNFEILDKVPLRIIVFLYSRMTWGLNYFLKGIKTPQ